MRNDIQRYGIPVLILTVGFGLGWLVKREKDGPPVATDSASSPPQAASPGAIARPARFSPGAGPAEAREFRSLSRADRKLLEERIREFHAASDDAERLELLERIDAESYGRDFLGLARGVLGPGGPAMGSEVRERVVEMLAGNTSAEILPVLELARKGASDGQRIQIMMAAARVRGRELEGFIAAGFEDPAKDVRFTALDAVDLQPKETRERLFARAMQCAEEDVGLAGLAELEVDATGSSLPVIMQGLSSPNAKVREETLFTLEFLLEEEFSSPDEARTWWEGNKHRFDRDLIRTD